MDTKYKNMLTLCENCISTLKQVEEKTSSKEIRLMLNQKLLILESALDACKESTDNLADTRFPFNFDCSMSLKEQVEGFEKTVLKNAILENGSKRKAAKALNTDHSTLIKKCQRYGI